MWYHRASGIPVYPSVWHGGVNTVGWQQTYILTFAVGDMVGFGRPLVPLSGARRRLNVPFLKIRILNLFCGGMQW